MPQYIKSVVAEVSPNLYVAAKSAGLTGVELTQVEQMSYTIKKHRELAKLDTEIARKQFDGLDTGVQDQLKFMFKIIQEHLNDDPLFNSALMTGNC